MDNSEIYQAPRSNFENKEYSAELVSPRFCITRKAPKELQQAESQLWRRVAPQRYAFLQTPWMIILFLLFLLYLFPLALPFLGLTLWQRNYPKLNICKVIEFFVFCLFVAGMVFFSGLFNLFIIGSIFLIYEKSSRSWYYLFNYMCLTSNDFYQLSKSKGWIKEPGSNTAVKSGRIMALVAMILFIAVFYFTFTL